MCGRIVHQMVVIRADRGRKRVPGGAFDVSGRTLDVTSLTFQPSAGQETGLVPGSPPPMTLGGHMGYVERPRRIVGPQQPAQQPFGQPAFGQPAFGQPSAGQPAPGRSPTGRTAPGHTSPGHAAPGPAQKHRTPAALRELYGRRGARLLDSVRKLDTGLDERACRALADWIRDEYASAHSDVPLGFVARCYLGPPYVDHQLSLLHVIVRHFAAAEPMPEPFAAARMTARSGGYAYVEVYSDGLILPVLDDGTVVRP
jgi:hypothetical protein